VRIIGADERLAERRGVKALIVGPTGVGKTSLLHTLDPARTLFIDIEAGDLSVQDVPIDTIRIDDWPTALTYARVRVACGLRCPCGRQITPTDFEVLDGGCRAICARCHALVLEIEVTT
jgi:hypothetical protein